jgi:hypothetical protein
MMVKRQLDADAVYLSPLGRRCRYMPVPVWGDDPVVAKFVYDDAELKPGSDSVGADGFLLTYRNWRILRQLANA